MPLKTKLTILLTAFTLIPLALFGGLVFSRMGSMLREARISQLNAIADLTKDRIESYFSERTIDIRTAQADPSFRERIPVLDAYRRNRSHPAYVHAVKELERTVKPFIEVYQYLDVMVVNARGEYIYASDPKHTHLGARLPDALRMKAKGAQKNVYFTDAFMSTEAEGRPVILGIAPILDTGGALIGELIFELDMLPLYGFLHDRTGLGETGEALIARREENSVLFLSPLHHAPGAAMSKRAPFHDKRSHAAQLAVQGKTGSGVTVDYRGEEVLAAWRYIPARQWGLVTKIDTSEAFSFVLRLKLVLLLAGSALAALAVLIAAAIAQAVTGPLQKLRKGAEAVSAGDLNYRVAAKANDEVGLLSRAFDTMTEALQKDIAGRQQAEDALLRLNAELETRVKERTAELSEQSRAVNAFFRHSITPLVFLDKEFNILRVNEAYAKACAREVPDFAGRNYFTEYPSDGLRKYFTQVVDTKEPFSASAWPFTFPDHPEWGTTYWDLFLYPILDGSGYVDFLVFVLNDVTERKNAEAEHARLVSAVEASAEAVVITDPERGIIQYVNPAFERITGFSREDAVGRDRHILDSGRHDAAFFSDMRSALASQGFWRGQVINRRKDGSLYHEESTVSPVRDLSGAVINYISVNRDVTEKLRLESIAGSMNLMENIGYVFAGVRHEIGNPVNSVKMALSVLRYRLETLSHAEAAAYVDRALSEIGRVEHLLKSLNNFNMYETPDLQIVNIRDFLARFLKLIDEDFTAKGISLRVEVGQDVTQCRADPRALQQVLLNIMTNAADALEGRAAPAIAVTSMREGGFVILSVSDNGVGMTADQQKDLFKPFFTSKPRGTGLGLVIVKKMLSNMNGDIRIASEPGKGTTVEIRVQEGTDASDR